jgi:hypothetical protein
MLPAFCTPFKVTCLVYILFNPLSRAFAYNPGYKLKILHSAHRVHLYTDKPGYNSIGLCDTLDITSGILRYQLIPPC